MRSHPNSTLLLAVLPLLAPSSALAVDDGARAYQLAPVGTQMLTAYGIDTNGNQSSAPGSVVRGSSIDVHVGLLQYTRVLDVGGHATAAFGLLPYGDVTARVKLPRRTLSSRSEGLGDAQLGIVYGLYGSPALSPQEYAGFRPGFSAGLLGKVFLPTGEYDSHQAVNLGSNRYAYEVGVPLSYALGESYRDPSLTTFDLLPAVIFYGENRSPYGADRINQKPLYGGEAHITHNFSRTFWMSADALFWAGGETRTDGQDDDNRQRSLSLGATAGVSLSHAVAVKMTYGEAVDNNQDGVEGRLARVVLTLLF